MTEKDERTGRGDTIPEAKRTGRERPDPHSQPGEFADEMRVNRFTPPPAPSEKGEK
ncbi:MAG TPA: hypothetical protein VNA04_03450 [Thermoanaerobaculia bacterium]|nr:hypothetical protein [Thermoanaerobaculia bacterium]